MLRAIHMCLGLALHQLEAAVGIARRGQARGFIDTSIVESLAGLADETAHLRRALKQSIREQSR